VLVTVLKVYDITVTNTLLTLRDYCWWDPAARVSDIIRSRQEVCQVYCHVCQAHSVKQDLSERRHWECTHCCFLDVTPTNVHHSYSQPLQQTSINPEMTLDHCDVQLSRTVKTDKLTMPFVLHCYQKVHLKRMPWFWLQLWWVQHLASSGKIWPLPNFWLHFNAATVHINGLMYSQRQGSQWVNK